MGLHTVPGPRVRALRGHTSCVALAPDHGPPTLTLDAGTGLRRLRRPSTGPPSRVDPARPPPLGPHARAPLLPGSRPGGRPRGPLPSGAGAILEVLERWMSPPHFPISPVELRGDWSFTNLEEGTHLIEGHTVLAREIPHKGGRTFGYRVSDGKVTVAYLSDHSPHTIGPGPDGVGEYHPAAVERCRGRPAPSRRAVHRGRAGRPRPLRPRRRRVRRRAGEGDRRRAADPVPPRPQSHGRPARSAGRRARPPWRGRRTGGGGTTSRFDREPLPTSYSSSAPSSVWSCQRRTTTRR